MGKMGIGSQRFMIHKGRIKNPMKTVNTPAKNWENVKKKRETTIQMWIRPQQKQEKKTPQKLKNRANTQSTGPILSTMNMQDLWIANPWIAGSDNFNFNKNNDSKDRFKKFWTSCAIEAVFYTTLLNMSECVLQNWRFLGMQRRRFVFCSVQSYNSFYIKLRS